MAAERLGPPKRWASRWLIRQFAAEFVVQVRLLTSGSFTHGIERSLIARRARSLRIYRPRYCWALKNIGPFVAVTVWGLEAPPTRCHGAVTEGADNKLPS